MNESTQKPAFGGVWCPSVTPLNEANAIDFDALARHFERLAASGIDGIVLMGSIGEFATLSIDERLTLIREARKLTSLPMMVHVSTTVVDDLQRLADAAYAAGCQSVLALPHYYFGQTPRQLEAYFHELNRRFSGPWLAYNFPARTGCDMDAALVAKLAADLPRMVGIKDTVDCQSHTRAMIQAVSQVRSDFAVLAGYDEYLATVWMAGGAGVISGLNNVVPQLFVQLRKAWDASDLQAFAATQKEIARLSAIYSIGADFVTTIKSAVSRKHGYMIPRSRNFGGELSAHEGEAIDALFAAY